MTPYQRLLIGVTGFVSLASAPALLAQESIQPVGQEPPPSEPEFNVQSMAEYGGVLTPRGRLMLEPEFQYTHESINRMTFEGVEVLSTLLIGVFTAQDIDRDSYMAAMTGRLGVTDRLELEMKVPYVYRDESSRVSVAEIEPAFDIDRALSNHGLGDIEVAAHYQLNRAREGRPIYIGNLRYKSTTGDGPFDIERNSAGTPRELPTGTGFHAIEPSLTMLFPSAPAVYFANLGYTYNLSDTVDRAVGDDIFVGKVDPGDAVRVSFGMAYAINPRTSFTLGYKNDFIGKTRTEYFDPTTGRSTTQSSSTLNVGALLLGWSYQLNQDTAINLNLEFGVTDDAPDTVLTLRIPFGMDLF
ncbi:transporter [Halomonas campaniensis]|jgi:hypothetical protein|uniref:transporter n=1 Tax=Halomonas campaniensis TaxID=213554 RepID=UPI0035660705